MDKSPSPERREPTQEQIEIHRKMDQITSGKVVSYRPWDKLSQDQKGQIRHLHIFYRSLSGDDIKDEEFAGQTDHERGEFRTQNDQFRANYHEQDEQGYIEFVGLRAADFDVDAHLFALEQIRNGFDFNLHNDPSGLHTSGSFKMLDGKQVVWKMFFSETLRPHTPQSKDLLTAKDTKRHVWVFTLEDLQDFIEFHRTANDSNTVSNTPESGLPLP